MIYDPTDHPLLSRAAQALGATELAAQVDTAETLLKRGSTTLADTEFEAGTVEHTRATLAVVYQVNFQLEAGVEGEVYGSSTRGGRSVGFRGGVLNPMPTVSPRAQAIVDTLITPTVDSAEWGTAGSLR